jgi:hypothetical protein
MILSALWKRHDSTTLILHISLLTNFFLVIGLLFWFGERWKYFKMTVLIVFMIGCIFATIHDWNRKDPWGYIFYPIWFLWGLYCLKEEIVKVKTTDDIQDASNEVLSGSEK